MLRSTKPWLLCLLILSAAACGPRAKTPAWDADLSGNPEAEAAFREARRLFLEGAHGEADERFARLIEAFPSDPLARAATVYRARVALEMGNLARTQQLLEPLIGADDPVSDRAELYTGVALYRGGNAPAALEMLAPLLGSLTDPDENALLLDTYWRTARESGKQTEAILAMDRYLALDLDRDTRDDITTALKEMAAAIDSIPSLKRTAKQLPDKENAWPILMARIAEIHLASGRFKESADTLDAIEAREDLESQDADDATEAIEGRANVNMNAVGLLVPLSGRSRLLGDMVVKGAMMAAAETGLNVIIRDTKGAPEQAADMAKELVEKENVFALVGPLDARAAQAAAAQSETLRTPILLLAMDAKPPSMGGAVFRLLPSHRAELDALMSAARQDGHQTVGILFPETPFGKGLGSQAKRAATHAGLTTAAEIGYPPNSTVYEAPAEEMAGARPDAVVILDTAASIALIAPALAAAGLWSVKTGDAPTGPGAPVQIMAPSFGFSTELARRAGRYLQGALFSVYFDPAVTPGAERFSQQYHLRYGEHPNYLSAFGRDAVILLHAAAQSEPANHDGVITWLTEQAGKSGAPIETVTHFKGFTAAGEPIATPWLAELDDGMFAIRE